MSIEQKSFQSCLKHVLFVPDGNGRWASRQGLPREEGHMAGTKYITNIIYECINHNIRYVSFFVFSTENWNRPEKEVKGIFKALADLISLDLLDWHVHGVQLRYIGNLEQLDANLQNIIKYSQDLTQKNIAITVAIIINYGARSDIVSAMQAIILESIPKEDITEQVISSHLSSANMPDPDLIIRTGGRLRISNVFLWELCYSELWFSDILWPDFRLEHLREAIEDFYSRNRTFGNSSETPDL